VVSHAIQAEDVEMTAEELLHERGLYKKWMKRYMNTGTKGESFAVNV